MKLSVVAVLSIVVTSCPLTASQTTPVWESVARLERFPVPKIPILGKAVSGTLIIESDGIAFHSANSSRRWLFGEIHTFDLSRRDLTLTLYQNRRWHEPGERRLHFKTQEPIPPSLASLMAVRVGRPVRNGTPATEAAALVEIPARHPRPFGGSNGMLRLRNTGVDYVSSDGRDSHSWRWSDIQTIANPDPYSFRVTAYREIVEFELKQPLSRSLFDEMWGRLYASDLNLAVRTGGDHE